MEVFHEGSKVGEVGVHGLTKERINNTVLIDYSCSGYNLRVFGLDEGFLSVGCEIIRENIKGDVVPTLNVNWISSEYKTLDLHHGPYVISFSRGREAKVLVKIDQGGKKEIQFKVDFPKSSYLYLVKDIESRLLMGKSSLNIEIADLYKRIDKPLASEVYALRGKETWENQKDVQKVVVPWYRAIFE